MDQIGNLALDLRLHRRNVENHELARMALVHNRVSASNTNGTRTNNRNFAMRRAAMRLDRVEKQILEIGGRGKRAARRSGHFNKFSESLRQQSGLWEARLPFHRLVVVLTHGVEIEKSTTHQSNSWKQSKPALNSH